MTSWACVVVDVDQLGGVLRLRQGVGDDQRDRLADIAHRVLRQAEMGAREHRRPIGALALERDPHRAELGRHQVVAGEDQLYAGRRLRRAQVELADMGVGMRRAQHIRMHLAEQIVVVLKAAIAAQQPLVLEAPHRLPDSELAHRA